MKIINKKDNKALIYYNNNFYVVSEANNEFTGFQLETLIFKYLHRDLQKDHRCY